MTRITPLLAVAFASSCFMTPAMAGEIAGSGDPIDIHGRSECAFSGYNDLHDE